MALLGNVRLCIDLGALLSLALAASGGVRAMMSGATGVRHIDVCDRDR